MTRETEKLSFREEKKIFARFSETKIAPSLIERSWARLMRNKGPGEGVETAKIENVGWSSNETDPLPERGDDGGPRGTKAARLKDAHFIGVARSNRPLKYLAALFVSVAPAELTRPRQLESDKKFRGGEKKKEKRNHPFFLQTLRRFSKFFPVVYLIVYTATFKVTTQIRISPF